MNPAERDLPEHEIIELFRKSMAENGLETPDKIEPTAGEIRRFHVKGDGPNTRNGWYVLFTDGKVPAGEFGTWKGGQTVTWTARDARALTPEERRDVQDRIDAARKQREADQRAREGEAARTANLYWNEADEADDSHPYLRRKQVPAHGLRIGSWPVTRRDGTVFRHIDNTLLVPVMDAKGKIISLQGIFPSRDEGFGRDKDFWRGGRKRGGFYIIGRPAPGGTVAICEGYATGATIHQATGWCVVVAFDAGNLTPVAVAMREAMPDCMIVITADNDQWTTEPVENPGVVYARQAAAEIGALCVVPQFADVSTRPSDWNDLEALEGIQECQRQLMAHQARNVVPAAANDNAPATVDTFTPLPDAGGSGKPLSTIENLAEVCRRLGVVVRYNVISKEEELLIPGHAFSVDNAANASLAWLMSWCSRFRMPTGNLGDFVTFLADQNLYNPVANWITSRPWDGTKRLPALYETVTPKEDKRLQDGTRLRDVLIKRWMVSAVAAAFQPNGVSAHGILVLQGDQYLGKTKWFKNLVPQELGVLKDGMILRPDDKDSVKQACSFWLVELGELDATFRKSDIAQLKSFITNQSDVLRRAYARKESHFARRTVFFGSVNPREYLHDPTGNRRYWTIEAAALNMDHGLDMQQVWAEVYELFKAGESYYLQPDEMAALNAHNEAFTVVDPIEERLQTRLDWDAKHDAWDWKTSTEVLISIGIEKPTPAEATKAALVIRKLNGGTGKRVKGRNLLFVPPKPLGKEDYDRPF
ncbi:VapE domain-containing protein [Microvirga sp. 17 mud 1-3]|uniref:VapE domain-containing protein n=1 Tax=Microvirga sp. 17 mud 1-3 TaxID=2082949 RepID=UPI000D6D1EE0|nr:VapE domain-containing protein [Microvirga sp. 17 mud 1-3]AWM87355.1 integrase [Microvirga sp. 17 mud 1-3]